MSESALETQKANWKFVRHENGRDVYVDTNTGKEGYVARPAVSINAEETLFTSLKALCQDALKLEAQCVPPSQSGDRPASYPPELTSRLLPEANRIATGPGREMAFAHFARGLILRILHRLPEAEAAFRKAHAIHPKEINTLRELVGCLGRQDKPTEALPFARQATEFYPEDSGAWGNLAMCLIDCGRRDDARNALSRALALDPEDPINCEIRDHYFKGLK